MSRNPFLLLLGLFGRPLATHVRGSRLPAEPMGPSFDLPPARLATEQLAGSPVRVSLTDRIEALHRTLVSQTDAVASEVTACPASAADTESLPALAAAGSGSASPATAIADTPSMIAGPAAEAAHAAETAADEVTRDVPAHSLAGQTAEAAEMLRSLVTPSLPEPERTALEALIEEADAMVAAVRPLLSVRRGKPSLPVSSRLYQVQKVNRVKATRHAAIARATIGGSDLPRPQRPAAMHTAPKRLASKAAPAFRRSSVVAAPEAAPAIEEAFAKAA